MVTISFKAEEFLKNKLEMLARRKGINTSAYIKLTLTKAVNDEMSEITENGMTVAEEYMILHADANDETYGPFESAEEVIKALRQKSE